MKRRAVNREISHKTNRSLYFYLVLIILLVLLLVSSFVYFINQTKSSSFSGKVISDSSSTYSAAGLWKNGLDFNTIAASDLDKQVAMVIYSLSKNMGGTINFTIYNSNNNAVIYKSSSLIDTTIVGFDTIDGVKTSFIGLAFVQGTLQNLVTGKAGVNSAIYFNASYYDSSGNLLGQWKSNNLIITESTPATIVSPPSNLNALALSGTSINLTWTDNSNNEEGFYIMRTNNLVNNAWTSIPLVRNSNKYTFTALTPNITYYFKVYAYNGTVNSNYSNAATSRTFTQNNICEPNWDYAYTECNLSNIKTKYYLESGTSCGKNPINYGYSNTTESCLYVQPESCTPNWNGVWTACASNGQRTLYYYQTGTNCVDAAEPVNITSSCTTFVNNSITITNQNASNNENNNSNVIYNSKILYLVIGGFLILIIAAVIIIMRSTPKVKSNLSNMNNNLRNIKYRNPTR